MTEAVIITASDMKELIHFFSMDFISDKLFYCTNII